MKEFVIYTVLVGDYDSISQPKHLDKRFDYVLFSNNIKESSVGAWTIKRIPEIVKNDSKRLSRYPKTHPETLLKEYEASLYIDANIQICDQWVYDRFVELYDKKVEYAGIKLVLTGRDCIYEHTFDMCQALLEHDYIAIKQCRELYKLGFPRHFGINENNVIFRIHSERMRKTNEEWWWWISNHSSRDQFSLMYCLWKHKIELNYFLPEGEDTRNGHHFSLTVHDGQPNVIKIKVIKRGFIEKLRIKAQSFNKEKSLNKWIKTIESNHPMRMLHIYGALSIINNIPSLVKLSVKGK